jgi:phosphate transport system substrate-binding protein
MDTSSSFISVISREDGSGTRGAFVELFGILVDGVDMTTPDASFQSSTSVVMTTVAGNPSAIGYISLGSLNDTVKALDIDGAAATVDNVMSGTYKVSRPFILATKAGLSDDAQDFMNYILSNEGQKVVSDGGYVSEGGAGPYAPAGTAGPIVVAGSSSVTPIMESLREAYLALNPDCTLEIQMSDSSTGMTAAIDGICDIGMASRELQATETAAGLSPTTIAIDGIAVIVNQGNPLSSMTSDNVKAIFTGEVESWSDIK